MKAAVYHGPMDIKTEEVEKPKIRDNRVLVNVKACGICGSDLHMYKLDLYTDILCWLLLQVRSVLSDHPSSLPYSRKTGPIRVLRGLSQTPLHYFGCQRPLWSGLRQTHD